jgi:type IV secretory pathway TraG/TraD family ATPase VirD4
VPGDSPPAASGGGGYYDYRGVLDVRRVPAELQQATFSLGRYLSPGRSQRVPIGLPEGALSLHVTLVGPTGAGKTTGIVVPWMVAAVRAGWSVVTIDVKGDLLARVQNEVGHSLGGIAGAVDYTDPHRSLRWNWLAEVDSDRAIDNTVQSILGRKPPSGTDPYFFNADSQILRGLLELVAVSKNPGSMTATKLLDLLKNQDRLTKLLMRTVSRQAITRLSDLTNLDPTDYPKRIAGVVAKLDTLSRGTLERVMSHSDFRAQDVLDAPSLLSIVAPLQDGQMAEMVSSLLINQILFRAFQRFGGHGGVPVLLVLDEAPRVADRIDLEQILSVARAADVAVLLALQDAAQFSDQNQRSVIFANSGCVICTQGVSSTTAKLMSDRLGVHPVATMTTSQGPWVRGQSGGPNLSTATSMAPVLGEREIMSPPFDGRIACVHARDLSTKPFFVDLTRP